MRLRRFNTAGIQAFEDFLAACREQPDTPLPLSLLEDEAYTETVNPAIEVEPMPFLVRSEAAHYFSGKLSALPEEDVRLDAGLWTWLALFYFDQVCPPVDGKRTVKNSYYYVFEPMNSRHFYRHLLFVGWRALQLAPEHNRLFLQVPLAGLDGVTREVINRLYLTRIPCIFEVLDRIYWDEKRSKPKRGIIEYRKLTPGNLTNRFPARIRQLEMTYDLQSLNAEQLIELLGREFQFK